MSLRHTVVIYEIEEPGWTPGLLADAMEVQDGGGRQRGGAAGNGGGRGARATELAVAGLMLALFLIQDGRGRDP